MKRTFLYGILFVFMALNMFSQNNDIHTSYTAKVIDKDFFQQLDSIVTNVYKQKYNYYRIFIWNKEQLDPFYIPNKSDSILYLTIKGADTPFVYGFHPFYEAKYKNRIYFIGKGADGKLIKKNLKKTYEVPISTIDKNMSRDMDSPSIAIKYQNKKLIVTSDSRTDPDY